MNIQTNKLVPKVFEIKHKGVIYPLPLRSLTLRQLLDFFNVTQTDERDELLIAMDNNVGIYHRVFEFAINAFPLLSDDFKRDAEGLDKNTFDKSLADSLQKYKAAVIDDYIVGYLQKEILEGYIKECRLSQPPIAISDSGDLGDNKNIIIPDNIEITIKDKTELISCSSVDVSLSKKFKEKEFFILSMYRDLVDKRKDFYFVANYVSAVSLFQSSFPNFSSLFGVDDILDIPLEEIKEFMPKYLVYNFFYQRHFEWVMGDKYSKEREQINKAHEAVEEKRNPITAQAVIPSEEARPKDKDPGIPVPPSVGEQSVGEQSAPATPPVKPAQPETDVAGLPKRPPPRVVQ